ncbi:hypothetical protein T439DRAFT_328423 [Meredithblackwellia eburnea MCA 4105]
MASSQLSRRILLSTPTRSLNLGSTSSPSLQAARRLPASPPANLARRSFATESTGAKKDVDSSHFFAGLGGGAVVLLGIYGYYHWSGTSKVVSQAKAVASSAEKAKESLISSAPSSPEDALKVARSLADSYVKAIPGGKQAVDTAFDTLDGWVKEHGSEVSGIINEASGEVGKALQGGKDAVGEIVKVLQKTSDKVQGLAKSKVEKALKDNKEWGAGLGDAVSKFQELGEKHGPEAKMVILSTFAALSTLITTKGLNADSLSEAQSIIKDKTSEISKIAGEGGQEAWKAAKDAAAPALEQWPDVSKLLGEKVKGLEGVVGEDNIKQIQSIYSELEKIGKSNKSTEEKAKEAKKFVESKIGSLDELKKTITEKSGDWGKQLEGVVGQWPDVTKLLGDKVKGLEGLVGEENVKQAKSLYDELEKIAKSDKSADEKAKEAKKFVESKVGTFDELKKSLGEKGGDWSKQVEGLLGGVPGLAGLGKIINSDDLQHLTSAAQKHGKDAEKLLESTYDEIKQVLEKKAGEAKKIAEKASGDVKKGASGDGKKEK